MNNLLIAVDLCKQIFGISESTGLYPAITGGTVYKEGNRKDIDIVIYVKNDKEISESYEHCTVLAVVEALEMSYKGDDEDFSLFLKSLSVRSLE